MKNNIEFYQHYADADQHPKFKMLRVMFGWEGEGKFWALNNRIAKADNCCLDIAKKYNKAAIASDLEFSLPKFDEFISYLLIECELIKECEPGIITTDIIQENFERVSSSRQSARNRSRRRSEKDGVSSPEKDKFSPEEVIKGKEKKGNENNKDLSSFPKNEEQDEIEDFYITKKNRRLTGKRLETFKQFWEYFNHKFGKAEAADAWLKIQPLTDKIVKKIYFAAEAEAKNRNNLIQKGQTPKMAQGWITGRRWEDEINQKVEMPKTIFDIKLTEGKE